MIAIRRNDPARMESTSGAGFNRAKLHAATTIPRDKGTILHRRSDNANIGLVSGAFRPRITEDIAHSPMIQIGFRMNRSRPQQPMYFDLQPALHRRTMYSTPKKTTRHISWMTKRTVNPCNLAEVGSMTARDRQKADPRIRARTRRLIVAKMNM